MINLFQKQAGGMGLKGLLHNNKGVTLMEIILVLVVMGILFTLTIPNFLRFNDRWILRSTAHDCK